MPGRLTTYVLRPRYNPRTRVSYLSPGVMRIAVDAMGGDHAPLVNVDGAVAAAREFGIASLLVGRRAELEPLLADSGFTGSEIEIVDAPEVVTMEDPATAAIRRKRNSSIRIAADCVRDGRAA